MRAGPARGHGAGRPLLATVSRSLARPPGCGAGTRSSLGAVTAASDSSAAGAGPGRAEPGGALPPAAGKVSQVWARAGRAPLAGGRCRAGARGRPVPGRCAGWRAEQAGRGFQPCPAPGRDLPSDGAALCREVAGPSPWASGSVESPRERGTTTWGERTVSRPGDERCRSSALAGQRSRPGDGDQGRQRENAGEVTHPDRAGTPPLVTAVLRSWSAPSPLSAHTGSREQLILIKSGPLCTTEIQTPRRWNLLSYTAN